MLLCLMRRATISTCNFCRLHSAHSSVPGFDSVKISALALAIYSLQMHVSTDTLGGLALLHHTQLFNKHAPGNEFKQHQDLVRMAIGSCAATICYAVSRKALKLQSSN